MIQLNIESQLYFKHLFSTGSRERGVVVADHAGPVWQRVHRQLLGNRARLPHGVSVQRQGLHVLRRSRLVVSAIYVQRATAALHKWMLKVMFLKIRFS